MPPPLIARIITSLKREKEKKNQKIFFFYLFKFLFGARFENNL